MAVLDVDLSFPHAPITSLQKRIAKGIEQLYYTKLFLTSPAYADGEIWVRWHDLGFHVAIFDAPPGTLVGDRVRVRVRAPSPTPHVSVTGDNAAALSDLESLVQTVDAARASVHGVGADGRAAALRDGDLSREIVQPLVDAVRAAGLDDAAVDDYRAMLQRGFDALTDDSVQSISVTVS
jgi:hypothetical protein